MAIRNNELMIGDWAIVHGPADQRFTRKLDIGDLSFFVEFEPIPLTPELLKKNGFIYNDSPFVQGWEQFGLTLFLGGNGFRITCGQNVAMVIDSVHELQHALRLCGIDKEIVL